MIYRAVPLPRDLGPRCRVARMRLVPCSPDRKLDFVRKNLPKNRIFGDFVREK
jgi:hypothetical protein